MLWKLSQFRLLLAVMVHVKHGNENGKPLLDFNFKSVQMSLNTRTPLQPVNVKTL